MMNSKWLRQSFLALSVMMAAMTALSAQAAELECEYQNRDNDFFFARLPTEIKGWVKCPNEKLRLNVFYVARLEEATKEKLIEVFMRYERVAVEDRQRTVILKEDGKDANSLFLEIETYRGEERTTHFVFTGKGKDNQTLAFVYTDTRERINSLRTSINSLKKTFTMEDYLKGISKAIELTESAPLKKEIPKNTSKSVEI